MRLVRWLVFVAALAAGSVVARGSVGSWDAEPPVPPIVAQTPTSGFPIIMGYATSTEDEFTTTHTIALPTGIRVGDLLIVFCTFDAEEPFTPDTPDGWTQLYAVDVGKNGTQRAWYRVADGTEGSTISVDRWGRSAHNSYRITNYDGNPSAGTPTRGTDTSPDPPWHAPVGGSAHYLWIAAAHVAAAITVTAPPNYGRLLHVNTGIANAWHAQMATAVREHVAALEDPGQFTIGFAALWAANTVAVRGR